MTEVDGVMGYQAATVAPAYTQPSAAAVLPSIRILSAVGVHLFRWNGSGQIEMLARVIVAQAQGGMLRLASCGFLPRTSRSSSSRDDAP